MNKHQSLFSVIYHRKKQKKKLNRKGKNRARRKKKKKVKGNKFVLSKKFVNSLWHSLGLILEQGLIGILVYKRLVIHFLSCKLITELMNHCCSQTIKNQSTSQLILLIDFATVTFDALSFTCSVTTGLICVRVIQLAAIWNTKNIHIFSFLFLLHTRSYQHST